MLNWSQLYSSLSRAESIHSKLEAIFQNFAKIVEAQVTDKTFLIKGISVSLHIENGYFTTTFAGRVLRFSFSSVPSGNDSLDGKVTCVLINEFPEKVLVPIGEFTFTASGMTSFTSPDTGGRLYVDDDLPTLVIALNFIHESLSK